jgi:flagellar motor switch protein FliM
MPAAQRQEEQESVVRLFDKAAFSSAKYPRLLTVFERMLVANLENLRDIISIPPQYIFNDIQAEELGAVLDRIDENCIAAIFVVREWQSRIVFTIDRAFIYSITEMVFGGDGSEPQYEDKRKFSQIERNIARAVLTVAARALQMALSSVAELTVEFERIETNMESVSIDNRYSKAVVAKFDLRAAGRSGRLQLVIPQSAIRASRVQPAASAEEQEEGSPDLLWFRQMQGEVKSTAVKVTAVLDERRMSLADVAAFRIGQVIPLDARVDGRIKLVCNDQPLFLCEIGQLEGAYSIRVDEAVRGREGVTHDVLSH